MMIKYLLCAVRILAVLNGADAECKVFHDEQIHLYRTIDFGENTATEFKFNMTLPEGEEFWFYVRLQNKDKSHELEFFLKLDELRIFNDYHVESRRFLAFIPRQGPIYSLKFSTYDDYYKIYINGVKAFMFLDNAIAKNNLTMNHMIYDGMQYVNEFTECVHQEQIKEY